MYFYAAGRSKPLQGVVLFILSVLTALPSASAAAKPASTAAKKKAPASPALFVHYMPWYEAKPVSPIWGWHWTMNHYNPDMMGAGDRRPIASHYYPLIGPYDSSDPHVLEYHALLMKLAGIDGVIVDWYGTSNFNDYALLHRNTTRLVDTLKRFDLKFAVCYEDQSVKQRVEKGVVPPSQAVEVGKQDLRWLKENWFKEPHYVKSNGKPLLLAFGGLLYFQPDQWKEMFTSLQLNPAFITQDHLREPAEGIFSWPPMWKSKDKKLTLAQVEEYLKEFYAKPTTTIGVAFPGFHDIYEEAGVHPSYGFLDADGGSVFTQTLRWALESKSPLIQIATWNDFGEGTAIEPAREYNYRYLEVIRQKRAGKRTVADNSADLRLPLRIYGLRKRAKTIARQKELDAVVGLLKDGDANKAKKSLDTLERQIQGAS